MLLAGPVFAGFFVDSVPLADPDPLSIVSTHAISQISWGGHSSVQIRTGQLHCPGAAGAAVIVSAPALAQQIANPAKIIVKNFMFASNCLNFQMLETTDIVSDVRQVFYTDFK